MDAAIPRRDLLKVGGLSLLGPALVDLLAGRATAARPARIKSCLFLFQAGGVSQIDTLDMKPEADENIRGEFRPIDSCVPGMPICEHMPKTARQMDTLCVVRSMYHRMLCHNPAIYAALAGREVGDSLAVSNRTFASRDDYPNYGSVVARMRPPPSDLPAFVSLPFSLRNGPAPSPGQHAGFLGVSYDPFLIQRDPSAEDFRVDELESREALAPRRLRGRRSLLEQFDAQQRRLEQSGVVEAMGDHYRRAFELLTTPRAKRAFALSQEDETLRDRYGRNLLGQSTLLGRRLVEAGVPFVTVYTPVPNIEGPSWDTHQNNFPMLKDKLLPPADQALAALLEDMARRGTLDETLVVWAGEFGRTPKIGVNRSNNSNNKTGRDHWPGCYTILLAGGGIAGGRYYGASDRFGWHPKDKPVYVGDLGATIYEAFGIDPTGRMRDNAGQPHFLSEGTPMPGLF